MMANNAYKKKLFWLDKREGLKLKSVIFFISLLWCYCHDKGLSQEHFSKVYDLKVSITRDISSEYKDIGIENQSNDFVISDDLILVLSKHTCEGDTALTICTSLSKYDYQGNLISTSVLKDFAILRHNNNLILKGDSISFSGHWMGKTKGRGIDVIVSDSTLKLNNSYTFLGRSGFSASNYGLIEAGDNYYLYGNEQDNSIGLKRAQIIKINAKNKSITWNRKYIYGSNKNNNVDDIHLSAEGDLVFINEVLSDDTLFHFIVKIDSTGNELGHFRVPLQSSTVIPRVLVTDKGEIYFSSLNEPGVQWPNTNGRINKLNADMSIIEWSLELPFDPFINARTYLVNDYLQASDGNIVVCGLAWDQTVERELDRKWHGFIAKVSEAGELLWLKLYKLPFDLFPQERGIYKNSSLWKIREKNSGGYVAIGSANYEDLIRNDYEEVWILSVGEDGCLQNGGCEEINILTSTSKPLLEPYEQIIYPNPTQAYLQIDDLESFEYELRDINGHLLNKGSNEKRIDIRHLSAGIYLLYLQKRGQNYPPIKVVKI